MDEKKDGSSIDYVIKIQTLNPKYYLSLILSFKIFYLNLHVYKTLLFVHCLPHPLKLIIWSCPSSYICRGLIHHSRNVSTKCRCFFVTVRCILLIYLYIWGLCRFQRCKFQVITLRVVMWLEETSTYSWSRFCTVNCQSSVRNYQLSHRRSGV